MDTETIIVLVIVLGCVFLITSQAKNNEGKKYGIRKMAKLWVFALGLLGAYSLLNPSVSADGVEFIRIPIVPIFLLLLPFGMIASKLIAAQKRKMK